MATIRKRGRRWYAEVRRQGVREGRSFATRAAAAAWALQREAEATGERLPHVTVREAIERYMREVVPRQRGSRWTEIRCRMLMRDARLMARPLSALEPADLAAWRDARLRDVSGATVAREMTVWRSMLETARREWGWLRVNPMRDVRSPAEGPPRERRVTDAEMEAMRLALGWPDDRVPDTSSARVALCACVALETAMRAGELLSLEWAQVDLEARVARLLRTKNGDSRDVPLSSRAVALLRLLPRDGASVFRLAPGLRDALWRKARTRAGIADLRYHDLRHEAITRLARKLDVLDLSRVSGHRDLRMLRRYYHPSASELAERLG